MVLIDEASASAEIVSGAVRLDHGLVLGRRSFGKGLVQRPACPTERRSTHGPEILHLGRCIQAYDDGVEAYRREIRTLRTR